MSKKQTRSQKPQAASTSMYSVPALTACTDSGAAGAVLDFRDGKMNLRSPRPIGRRARTDLREALESIQLAVRPLMLTKLRAVMVPRRGPCSKLDARNLGLLLQSFEMLAAEERALRGCEIAVTASLWREGEQVQLGENEVDTGYRAGAATNVRGGGEMTLEVREAIRRCMYQMTAAWQQIVSQTMLGWACDSGIAELEFEQCFHVGIGTSAAEIATAARAQAAEWMHQENAASVAAHGSGASVH